MGQEVVIALIMAAAGIITAIGAMLSKLANLLMEIKTLKQQTTNLKEKFDYETKPNHGSSLKDALNRIERAQSGTMRDIGRQASVDLELHETKTHDHKVIHKRLDDMYSMIIRLQERKDDETIV